MSDKCPTCGQAAPKHSLHKIARLFVDANPAAGRSYTREDETPDERAANLIRKGYVGLGDPGGWSEGNPIATIISEPAGGPDDCVPPANYHDGPWPVLNDPNLYWEWVNAAVGAVWED